MREIAKVGLNHFSRHSTPIFFALNIGEMGVAEDPLKAKKFFEAGARWLLCVHILMIL